MAYGDLPLDAPLKPNKGHEAGACNRQSCQAEPALYYNHGMHKWYCRDCARDIGDDHVNRMGWVLSEHHPGHPQFETREQIDKREAAKQAEPPPPPKPYDLGQAGIGKSYTVSDLDYRDMLYSPRKTPPASSSLERMLKKAKRGRK